MLHPVEIHPFVIPTVLLPLTAISVGLSAVASFLAALVGVQLKWEGPKKLLEVLLKPKILLISALITGVFAAGSFGYRTFTTYPKFIRTLEKLNPGYASIADSIPDFLEPYSTIPLKEGYSSIQHPNYNFKSIWKVNLGEGSFRGPIPTGQTAWMAGLKGSLFHLDLNSGKVLHHLHQGTPIVPYPVIWNGFAYTGEGVHDTHHARLYRWNLKTGKLDTYFQSRGHIEGGAVIDPTLSPPLAVVSAGKDGIYGVHAETLKPLWKVNEGHVDGTALIHQGFVYVGTGREKGDAIKVRSYALAIESQNGTVLWKHEMPASSWMKPFLFSNEVCFVFGEVYFKSDVGGFRCFHPKTGALGRSAFTNHPLVATPAFIAEDPLTSDIEGQVCRYDAQTLKPKWCFQEGMTEGKKIFSRAIYDAKMDLVLYASYQKGLFVLNPRSGKKIGHLPRTKDQGNFISEPLVMGNQLLTVDDQGHLERLEVVPVSP